MPTPATSGNNRDFTFIPVELDDDSKPRRTKKARSHTARVIRRRLREQDAVASSATLHNSSAPSPTEAPPPDGDRTQTLVAVNSKSPSPHPLSPVFGALSVDTFHAGTCKAATEAANYCLTTDWPNLLTADEASAWFQMFCKHPVIMHGFCYASATHQDILRGGDCSLATRRDILTHKAKTFRLLRGLVADASDDNVELILFAVLIMWHYDLQDHEIRDHEASPFRPHMPDANWLHVYGRTQGVEAHVRPLKTLLDRAGGIGSLKLPGLAFAISCGDLIAASIALQTPSLPQYWTGALSIEELCVALQIQTPIYAGSGFLNCPSHLWPDGALNVYVELASVDRVLEATRSRQLTVFQTKSLVDSRNATQHRLLSLPSLSALRRSGPPCSTLVLYESCRLTSILYSNAVIFPLPLNTGWHRKLLTALRGHLITFNPTDLADEVLCPLIWCLVVGGIAAHSIPDRKWFAEQLIGFLRYAGMKDWNEVESCLSSFLWSIQACGEGAAVLWQVIRSQIVAREQ